MLDTLVSAPLLCVGEAVTEIMAMAEEGLVGECPWELIWLGHVTGKGSVCLVFHLCQGLVGFPRDRSLCPAIRGDLFSQGVQWEKGFFFSKSTYSASELRSSQQWLWRGSITNLMTEPRPSDHPTWFKSACLLPPCSSFSILATEGS